MKNDRKVRIEYTLKNGRRSSRSIWLSQLTSAIKRNEAKGIMDTRVTER